MFFVFSSPNINAPPIIKNTILKVDKVIGSLGTSKVVGPITTAYIEPIINPKIKYTILDLWLFRQYLIPLIVVAIPVKTPNPNITRSGTTEKSNFKNDFIALIIGTYIPNISNNVEPDIPGNTIADIAIIPTTKMYIPKPMLRLSNDKPPDSPLDTGLKYVIAATIIIPIIKNIIFWIYGCLGNI